MVARLGKLAFNLVGEAIDAYPEAQEKLRKLEKVDKELQKICKGIGVFSGG